MDNDAYTKYLWPEIVCFKKAKPYRLANLSGQRIVLFQNQLQGGFD